MDDAHEKTLAVLVVILAARKLTDLPGDGADLRRKEIVYTAILHAETIDHRWPRDAKHMNSGG